MSAGQIIAKGFLIYLVCMPRVSMSASEAPKPNFEIDKAIEEIKQRRESIKSNTERLKRFFSSHEFSIKSKFDSRVIDLSPHMKDALFPLQALDSQNELILAFSPHHYHTFVIAGDFELHGAIYPKKSYYRYVRDNAFRSGFFVRFLSQSVDDIIRTKQYIKFMDKHKSELCMHASLEVLARGADINLNKKVRKLSALVQAILEEGFVDSKGDNIPIQIFKTTNKDIRTILKEIHRIERIYFVPGFLGYYGAKIGRLRKNKSMRFLEEHDYYLHSKFPSRQLK